MWPEEMKIASGAPAVLWTALEEEKLRKSVKENGLDDWTLGDWAEVLIFLHLQCEFHSQKSPVPFTKNVFGSLVLARGLLSAAVLRFNSLSYRPASYCCL